MQRLEVSGAVRDIYIYNISRLRVNRKLGVAPKQVSVLAVGNEMPRELVRNF
jgi:hypothetical protein